MTRAQKVAACRVREIDGGYEVTSPSGHVYHVRTTTHLDEMGSMYFRRHCDCPARAECVHLAAVDNYAMAKAIESGDYDGADALERVTR